MKASEWNMHNMRYREARGFSLMTVIFVMFAMSVVGVAAVSLISSTSTMVEDEYRTQQAFDVAQAGVQYVANILREDSNWSDNVGATKAFGSGSFTVTFLAQTFNTATIRSDGTVDGITRSVTQGMEIVTAAFNNMVYTEGDIVVSGSTSGDVYGPTQAGGAIDTGGGVTFHDSASSNDATVDAPDVDWSYWQGVATSTISGSHSFLAGTHSGIYYIDGNVTINSDTVINGTIVATGKVTLASASNITIASTAPNPAIVAGDDVTISGSTNVSITGFIVSMASIILSGDTEMTGIGGFVAVEDVNFGGSSVIDLTYSAEYAPSNGFIGGESSGLVLSSWREIF